MSLKVVQLELDGDFLRHDPSASGSGWLKRWREDGEVVVWLHKESPIFSVWTHSWPHYVVDKDEDSGTEYEKIVHRRQLCLETHEDKDGNQVQYEKLLSRQHWREDDGLRTMPPRVCPFDLCIEWVREQIAAGKMKWTDPLFMFETQPVEGAPDLGGEKEILYAGGFSGLFKKRDKTREELALMHSVNVKESEAYLQDGHSRQQYLMVVANDSDPDSGWVTTFESRALGRKLQSEIDKQIKRCDGDRQKGSPRFNPYPFVWTYDDTKDFEDKYDVIAKTHTGPSEDIKRLFEEDMPSIEQVLADMTPRLGDLYDSMTQAAQVDMPLHSFFEAAEKLWGMKRSDAAEGEEQSGDAPEVGATAGETEQAGEGEEEEADTCDVCGTPMGPDQLKCDECGATYVQDEEGYPVLATRPCDNEEGDGCMEKSVLVEDGNVATCPQCGTVHTMNDEGEWTVEVPKDVQPEPSKPKGRRRGKAKPTAAATVAEGKTAAAAVPVKHSDAQPARRARQRAQAVAGRK